MAINEETISVVGPDIKELLGQAPWTEWLKENRPYLWDELDHWRESPREWVIIRLIDMASDPWKNDYPNGAAALRTLWEIGEKLMAEQKEVEEDGTP